MILILVCSLFAGCGQEDPGTSAVPDGTKPESTKEAQNPGGTESATPAQPESVTEILDREGKKLGAIDSRASATAADKGVFYSIWAPAENAWTGPAEYRFFRASDGKDIRLGTLEDQGYEAVYTRTELGGKIYTLALVGNPYDDKTDTLCLLAADPIAETLTKTEISKDGFPYAAMAAASGKLLIMNHETGKAKSDKVRFSFVHFHNNTPFAGACAVFIANIITHSFRKSNRENNIQSVPAEDICHWHLQGGALLAKAVGLCYNVEKKGGGFR